MLRKRLSTIKIYICYINGTKKEYYLNIFFDFFQEFFLVFKMVTIIEDIVNDSNFLKLNFQDISSNEFVTQFDELLNIRNKSNIIKLYKNNYDFTYLELLNLSEDLLFWKSVV